jgi:hypothetical protein
MKLSPLPLWLREGAPSFHACNHRIHNSSFDGSHGDVCIYAPKRDQLRPCLLIVVVVIWNSRRGYCNVNFNNNPKKSVGFQRRKATVL